MLPVSGPAGPASSGPNLTRPGMLGCAENFVRGSTGSSPSEGGSGLCSFVNGSPAWFASTSEVRSPISWGSSLLSKEGGVEEALSGPDQEGQHQQQESMEQDAQAPRRDRAEGVRIVIAARQGRQHALKSFGPRAGGRLCVHESSRRR